MKPEDISKLLREKGLCGHISGDKPFQIACILSNPCEKHSYSKQLAKEALHELANKHLLGPNLYQLSIREEAYDRLA